MKPDWKDAPEWANYLAKDMDGAWYWYEDDPYKCNGALCVETGERVYAGSDGMIVFEERPK